MNCWVNSLVPNPPFLCPLKTENRKVFWYFQRVEKGCIGNEWVSCLYVDKFLTNKIRKTYLFVIRSCCKVRYTIFFQNSWDWSIGLLPHEFRGIKKKIFEIWVLFWLLLILLTIFINFFSCYLADPRPTFGHCRGGSLINSMLITFSLAFGNRDRFCLVLSAPLLIVWAPYPLIIDLAFFSKLRLWLIC